MIRIPALVALVLASSLALAAAPNSVYKWKDASGAIHYSDAPPPQGVAFTKVKAGLTGAGTADAPAAATAPEQPAADTDATAAAAKQTKAQANAKLCQQARDNVKLLQGNGPLMINRDGKQEPLADAGRAGELKRAQAAATLYCG